MSRKQTPLPATDAPTATEPYTLEYIGPLGQTSPFFGALDVGQRYQADPAFADYLVRVHPTHWRLAVATSEEDAGNGR